MQSPKLGLEEHGCFLHLQNEDRAVKFGTWIIPRPVSAYIQIKITFPIQKPPVASKAPNHNIKNMNVLCDVKSR